jgi:hypothetical protein
MSAENARPTTGTGAFESAGGPENRVARTGPLCGCPLDHHECGVHDEVNEVPCSRICTTWDMARLVEVGRRYPHGCPCAGRGAA